MALRVSTHKKPRSAGFFVANAVDFQPANAAIARAVMSSTLPMPLMARYLGAAVGSCWAHAE